MDKENNIILRETLNADKEYEIMVQTKSALANIIKENLCLKWKILEIESIKKAEKYTSIDAEKYKLKYQYYIGKAKAFSEVWGYMLFPNGYSEDDDDYKEANKKLTEKTYEKLKEKRDAKSRK